MPKTIRMFIAVAVVVMFAAAAGVSGSGAAVAAGPHGNGHAGNNGGVLHVATNGSDSNDCTGGAPCLTISHAVSIAPGGARVLVRGGTYGEQVTITKQVSLEAAGQVTIDTTGKINGIVVSGAGASGTSISGFSVENAIGEGILVMSTSNVTVRHNTLTHNDTGVNTTVTPECAPSGEIPGDCGEALHLMSVTNSSVFGNDIEHNVGGILITDELGPSRFNVIADNTTSNNAEDCGITLPSHNGGAVADPSVGGVYNNIIVHNVSDNNGGAGVGMFAPFPGTASYNNLVVGNSVRNNGEAGVGIHAHAPRQNVSGNVIMDNRVSGNGVDPDAGSGGPVGIALFSAVDPQTEVVRGNHIDNEMWGIFIAGPVTVTGIGSNHFGGSVTNATNQ